MVRKEIYLLKSPLMVVESSAISQILISSTNPFRYFVAPSFPIIKDELLFTTVLTPDFDPSIFPSIYIELEPPSKTTEMWTKVSNGIV